MEKLRGWCLSLVVVFFAAIAAQAQSTYEPYWFATLAGLSGVGGTTNGVGRAARFSAPAGVAVDSAGNIYVADRQNYAIRKITPAGMVTTVVSGYALLQDPRGMAVDSAGNLYTTHGCAIRKITPDGTITTLAGERASCYTHDGAGGGARFDFPAMIAVDEAGYLYVTETDGCTVRKVTPTGVVTTLAGLSEVTGSADGTGNAARFQYPYGIAVDRAGYIYVADWGNDTIRKITPTGDVTTFAGLAHGIGSNDGVGSAARFYGPNGVAVDGAGNVYVADGYNQTIRKITPAGVTTTLAGLVGQYGGQNGNVHGTGSDARFFTPGSVAVDNTGNLFVADGDWTIRIGGAPVTLTDAQSVKSHGLSGAFPIRLALAGEATVECRDNLTGEHTLVFAFTKEIAHADAMVTAGTGSLSGNPMISGNEMTLNLIGVANAQTLCIALRNIVDVEGELLPDMNISVGFLLGDTILLRSSVKVFEISYWHGS